MDPILARNLLFPTSSRATPAEATPPIDGDDRCMGPDQTCQPMKITLSDVESCVRGAEGLSEDAEVQVQEIELGQGASLALVRIEDDDTIE